ncbi:MAG TPA: hypothetical protein VK255_03095 [Patescibacteria group bacterium]|nr:hypothetical protein [Patescibacteria group bacterium]
MHQTFYIDIDEEITSVVERLKKARASEIIMVVPKRALLIQSIINLRLLKKEAEGMGLQLMIVTQDKLGKLLIEKAGILVQQKLEDTEDEIVDIRSDEPNYRTEGNSTLSGSKNNPDTARLSKLGSDNFFQSSKEIKEKPLENLSAALVNDNIEKITNKELVSEIGKDIRKEIKKSASLSGPAKRMDMGVGLNSKNVAKELNKPDSMSWGPGAGQVGRYFMGENDNSSFEQDKKIENFFHPENNVRSEKTAMSKIKRDFSGLKKFFLSILVLAILLGLGAAAYMFIPKADIALSFKQKIKEQDYTIKGDSSKTEIDMENEIIPVRIIEVTSEVTKEFPTSGKKSSTSSSSSQKARGTITIYNEFSNSPQPLVATTRFMSESGKIFRLVNGVTVPGTSKVGEETKPGAIEAEVIADEAGDGYNIEPTKFSIPGFKDNGNDKYNKIYGKSTKTMSGGGSASSDSEANAITADDLARAKSDIVSDLNKDAKEKLVSNAGQAMLLDDAINNEEATYKSSNAVGEVVDKFKITAQSRSQAIVFDEKNLKELIGALLAKSVGGTKSDNNNISLEYGKSLPDFKNKTLDIKVHAVGKAEAGVDLESFKSDIGGKNNEEFESYLSNYPDISKAEVVYWPPFISRIPRFSQRINITLDISQ